MKKKYFNIKLFRVFLIMAFLTGLSKISFAQDDQIMYFLRMIPQSGNVNPAFIPDYKFYIGVPFLSSVHGGFNNSFTYNTFLQKKGDSLYLERDYILDNLKKKIITNFEISNEILSFGIRVKKNYFNFRLADIASGNAILSKDMLEFLFYGNGNEKYLGKTTNLDGPKINANFYHEFSLGYSRQITSKITAGVNLKYLSGIANTWTEKCDFNIYTNPDDYTITAGSHILFHTSLPDTDSFEDFSGNNFFEFYGNNGFAIDLGAKYKINKKFSASFSLKNLGFIKWNSNVKSYETEDPSKSYTYEGVDINDFFDDDELNWEKVQEILDSISDELGIVEVEKKYKAPLSSKLYLNLDYNLTVKDQFGLLGGINFVDDEVLAGFTLAYTRKFNRDLNLLFSYSLYPQNYMNLGLGFAANMGPVQFYLINEGFTSLLYYKDAKAWFIRFGFNLVFGKNNRKPLKDAEIENL